jgi:hypothetical protein
MASLLRLAVVDWRRIARWPRRPDFNPVLDRRDRGWFERPVRRHLQVARAANRLDDQAFFNAAWRCGGPAGASAQQGLAGIEAQVPFLYFRPMALAAGARQYRTNVLLEVLDVVRS